MRMCVGIVAMWIGNVGMWMGNVGVECGCVFFAGGMLEYTPPLHPPPAGLSDMPCLRINFSALRFRNRGGLRMSLGSCQNLDRRSVNSI